MKTTFFGLNRYSTSLQIQNQARRLVEQTGFPVVLGFEFYPTLTVGSGAQSNLKLQNDLQAQGVEIVESGYEDGIHLYTPGQLVIYPLVPLEKLKISLVEVAKLLEEATVLWLQKYQIDSFSSDKPGVFTPKGQIAALNIQEIQGISCFGISLNLSNDTSVFQILNSEQEMDSVLNYDIEIDLKSAFDEWILYWTSVLLKAIPDSK